MELPEGKVDNEAGWVAIVGGAILIAAVYLIRLVTRFPGNGQKEFRESIKRDIERLDHLHEKVDDLSNRTTAVETAIKIRREDR